MATVAAAAAANYLRVLSCCLPVDHPTNFLTTGRGCHGALSVTRRITGNQEPESLVAHPSCHMGGWMEEAEDRWWCGIFARQRGTEYIAGARTIADHGARLFLFLSLLTARQRHDLCLSNSNALTMLAMWAKMDPSYDMTAARQPNQPIYLFLLILIGTSTPSLFCVGCRSLVNSYIFRVH